MINTSRFLLSVFSICILTIGMISLQAQITEPINAESPNINQQTETDDKTLQNEQPRVEMP